ncbi:hypothetical protein D4A35_17950 (plasmid) [Paraclostridium bifermentans]|uniref:Hemolysin-like protein n=1 Tax=Paraclostridium bifermentans TaxID=1490 RepID=O32337_PARBF|nr:aegerolysin family protein [Paraclostridium bifermentans]QEZ70819.1 hypothetical protein D4A35_17950 [Paraclostridium bifermentans]CAA71483.1 hemolysin-like protein [[Clostridium] bifermentans] [Paraclostridium bifermentans]
MNNNCEVNCENTEENKSNRAYRQWVKFHIEAVNEGLKIRNASLKWGKFHDPNNKDIPISPEDISKINIEKHDTAIIASSGKENTASGTEGVFYICDENEDKIAAIYWDCPWSGSNKLTIDKYNTKFAIEQSPTMISSSGAIGDVNLKVSKIWA